jgi:plasmid stabilization system protein ParE
VAAIARDAAAVVVTSRALADRFAPLNPHVVILPCLFDVARATPPSPVGAALRIGCFGGAFRRASFRKHILPAARDMDRARPVELVVTAALAEKPDSPMLTIAPFQLDFAAFVTAWRGLALNGVAHPYGETGNIAYKGPGSVLAASYLGAAPIVADEPAYAGMDETMGVLKADRSVEAWRDAFERLSAPGEAARLFGRLDIWRRESFDPEHARAPFERLETLARPGRSRPGVQIARLRGALAAARRRLSA